MCVLKIVLCLSLYICNAWTKKESEKKKNEKESETVTEMHEKENKICLESGQKRWLVDGVVTLF